MERALKIAVALFLILSAFTSSPDFDLLVGFIVIVALGILAYNSHLNKKLIEMTMYLVIIGMFQPFYELPIEPKAWLVLDIVIAVGLIISAFVSRTKVVESNVS
ncbi:DUF6804 family protein [Myroides marinus]|uniref:SPW repeat-containing protein n=1 Tax=Myroides marinus TaxID=703342 RepID=A0A164AIE9_9FLAO|nr:DUF6804 family protein [Myroides marinus]KZE83915.1 hypothetical protein AV926_03145 [Myroides marinus]MDM1370641.1 hypothetical protein [Myroides marinus]